MESKLVTIKRIKVVAYPMAGVSCATVFIMTDEGEFHAVSVGWKENRDRKLVCARPGDQLKIRPEGNGYHWVEDVIYRD